MATLTARGFGQARHRNGGEPVVNEYGIASGETIYPGDPVTIDSNGLVARISTITGAGAEPIRGIAAEYVAQGTPRFSVGLLNTDAEDKIRIYDDLENTVFRVVATDTGTISEAEVLGSRTAYSWAYGTASTTLKQSRAYVDLNVAENETLIGFVPLRRFDGPGANEYLDSSNTIELIVKVFTATDLLARTAGTPA